MADFDSSLPVRTQTNGDVAVKVVDGTIVSQQMTVNADGSVNVTDNGGSLTVDQGTSPWVVGDGGGSLTVDATNLDIRDLVFATDKVDVSNSTVALDSATLAALESITVQNGAGAAAVNIQDGGNSITVDGTLTVTATDLDIRDLDATQDNVAISDGTDTLAINADGSLNAVVTATDLDIRNLVFATDKVDVTGSTVALDAGTLAALESITVQNGAGAAAVNIQDGGNSITVDGTVTVNQGTSPWVIGDGGGSITVDATDLDIRDLTHVSDSVKIGDGTDFLAINTDGSINVNISSDVAGTEVNNYSTATALAAAASSNHDYTVTAAKTLLFGQVEAAASGKLKIEVQVESGVGTGTFATRFVQFNSTANPNCHIEITSPISVAAGVRVRIIRTNLDLLPQNVYSTISGQEVP